MKTNRKFPLAKQKFGKKALALPPLAGFDFETDGLGGKFIVGAITTSDGERELFSSLQAVFDWMLEHPQYRYLAHNAVGYEFAYLYPLIYDHFMHHDGVSIVPTIQGDTRIVQIRIVLEDKTSIDIRDTLCLFNMSLAKVADAFCPEIPKLKEVIDFEKETFDPGNPLHIEYVFRDCDIVVLAYQRHAKNMEDVFGSPLGVTAGSTALKAFKTTLPEGKKYYRVRPEVEEFIRRCYYGGLVLPGHQIGNWGPTGSIDVNAAYAFQMGKYRYPVGSPATTSKYMPGEIGFYQVIATVPQNIYDTLGFSPIPRRGKEGLLWDVGTFETFITSPEIDYAREVGCEIDVLGGYVFFRSEYIFTEFVNKCQEMELANGGAYKPSIKQNRNSCYGKFGAKSEHKSIVFSKGILNDVSYIPMTNEDTGTIIPGLYVGEEKSDAEYMLPHLAALITAYERLYLMRFIQEAYRRGAPNVYTDTDSIKCDMEILTGMINDGIVPIGKNYGEFKLEDICQEFIVLGPKCFLGKTEDGYVVKAKGVPIRTIRNEGAVEVYEEAVRCLSKRSGKREDDGRRSMNFTSVKSVMNIIKENSIVQPVRRKRKITNIKNSFAWKIDNQGHVYPRSYQLSTE